jgi:putative transposase
VGADFSTVEVLSWRSLVTYYVLFFVELESRREWIGGITQHQDASWMQQVARNATLEGTGYLNGRRYLLHDRDQKFCREFRETLAGDSVKCLTLPARSPNLNSYSERRVHSVKAECMNQLILFGEGSLRRALRNFCAFYHAERTTKARKTDCYSIREAALLAMRMWS